MQIMGQGRLKHGSKTGFQDMNGTDILVGDEIMLADGSIWYVNSYLQAVPRGEGKALKLREVVHGCEVVEPEGKTPEKKSLNEEVIKQASAQSDLNDMVVEKAAQAVTEVTVSAADQDLVNELWKRCEGDAAAITDLFNLTNQDLVKVLRDRGVEVTAREKIITYLDL